MPRVNLTGGAYKARSVTASVQRCLNLFPESVPQSQGEPAQFIHYPTAGLTSLATPPTAGPGRCLYRASNGQLFAVVGGTVYFVTGGWTMTSIGTIIAGTTPVYMTDNGIDIVLVDGSGAGYQIGMADHSFIQISDEAFYGATRCDTMDTFMVFNRPGTNQFYSTSSNTVTPFDPLYIAGKVGFPDPLVTLIVRRRELWLIGQLTTEIWFDSGASDFPFQIMPGPFIQHGCVAPYSLGKQNESIYWISQDENGSYIVVRGTGYEVQRVSTHAIEAEWATYPKITDAVALTYQQGGHSFYQVSFPTANKTWCFDEITGLWHEKCWLDANGQENRHRLQCAAYAYTTNVGLDWANGTLYKIDPQNYTDNGQPIKRLRSFPHLVNDGKRAFYTRFAADMQVGFSPDTTSAWNQDSPLDIDSSDQELELDGVAAPPSLVIGNPPIGNPPPQVYLRWSDNQGVSYGNALAQSLGATGEYLTQAQWQRLGMARSRVFELSWSEPVATALTGAFIDVLPSGS